MTHHHGWLYIEEANGSTLELFNHARTAAYLANSSVLGCGVVSGVLDDGGCASYRWVPPADGFFFSYLTDDSGNLLTDDDGNLLLDDGSPFGDGEGWTEASFADPITDSAPWYNASFPESAEVIGFWVTEWTGLDSGHVQRSLTQVGSYGGGGVFGASGSTAREMGFEVILIGESEKALDYLYRWLDATVSSVCATCQTNTIIIRRYCSDDGGVIDPLEGVVEMGRVGMLSGLQWGAPPVERAGCFMRRVNFTMAAEDPCMYGACEPIGLTQNISWGECFAAADLDPDRESCRPDCADVAPECYIQFDYEVDDPSAVCPVVTLTAPGNANGSIPVRIRTYANERGLAPEVLCSQTPLGELYVEALPPFAEFRYDAARRRVEFKDPSTGQFINAFAYVGPNDPGIPRFFALGCGNYTTIIDPADWCLDSPPDIGRDFLEVTLELKPRMGCA